MRTVNQARVNARGQFKDKSPALVILPPDMWDNQVNRQLKG